MSPLAKPQAVKGPLLWSIAGALLISIDPFLVFAPLPKWAAMLGARDPVEFARQVTFFGHFALGLPGLMVGFFLLAPLFVWVSEKLFGRIVAAMFGLQYSMLRQQLSGGIKRAAGTAAALMVGLATLVVLQAQGNTALNGWQLPTHFPDIFITAFFGLNQQQMQKLARAPGIKPGELMPIAIASPEYGSNLMNIGMATVMPNATMFFGVDPDLAFEMMELEFRDGDPKSAAEALKKGRHLVVTEEFRQLKGLKVGDKLSLKTARHGIVDYTIAGVVWSPGIDVMVISFDLGPQFDTRTAASVFGSVDDAREDFGVDNVYLFAANLEPGLERKQLIQKVQQSVGALGMNAYDVRHIKSDITNGLRKLLLVVSTVAFSAMGVASLGVTNTIMASIRSRRWQFGILRSIGVTRSGLLRLVMAEAVLLGIVGCALGLAAGMLMFADAHELGRMVVGYKPPASIPWAFIALGVGIVMLISILASLGPAIGVSRSQPLDLLQAGRAAA
jgi:putative ABC transport system permease protein